ncbi:hypothetical protein [Methylobacter sp.]
MPYLVSRHDTFSGLNLCHEQLESVRAVRLPFRIALSKPVMDLSGF